MNPCVAGGGVEDLNCVQIWKHAVDHSQLVRERSKKFNKLEAVILMKMTMKPNMFNVLEVDEPNRSLGSQATETGMMSIRVLVISRKMVIMNIIMTIVVILNIKVVMITHERLFFLGCEHNI